MIASVGKDLEQLGTWYSVMEFKLIQPVRKCLVLFSRNEHSHTWKSTISYSYVWWPPSYTHMHKHTQ
jgi:hypothetical protein